jgi:transcriptional regulator with XRE-family HTH domain
MNKLAAQVKKILATGMSPEGLADKIGVSLATIYRWKIGKSKPHKVFLEKLRQIEEARK